MGSVLDNKVTHFFCKDNSSLTCQLIKDLPTKTKIRAFDLRCKRACHTGDNTLTQRIKVTHGAIRCENNLLAKGIQVIEYLKESLLRTFFPLQLLYIIKQ